MKFKMGPPALWARIGVPGPPYEPFDMRTFIPPIHGSPRVRGMHYCGCARCDADLAPSGHRLGVGHFAVHLGDNFLQPRLAGGDLSHCVELLVGAGGWAICSSRPPHLCERCGVGYCAYRIYSDDLSVTNLDLLSGNSEYQPTP